MSVIDKKYIQSFHNKMKKGKTISFDRVRKFAKGGRVSSASPIASDIKQMQEALKSNQLTESSKEALRNSIKKAQAKLKSEPKAKEKKTHPSLLKKAISANRPKGAPSCDDILKKYAEQAKKRKNMARRPAPTAGVTIKKAADVAVSKIEDNQGKLSSIDQKAIELSLYKMVDSVKDNKAFVKSLIKKLQTLL